MSYSMFDTMSASQQNDDVSVWRNAYPSAPDMSGFENYVMFCHVVKPQTHVSTWKHKRDSAITTKKVTSVPIKWTQCLVVSVKLRWLAAAAILQWMTTIVFELQIYNQSFLQLPKSGVLILFLCTFCFSGHLVSSHTKARPTRQNHAC